MDLPPVAGPPRRQLSQDVASYVREQIISGRKRKGDFFRIEAVAKAMQISSTPVREGLLLLQLEGFVKLEPRRGFRVVGFSRQDVHDIFWTQALLAGELAARAALAMNPEDCRQLQELVEQHHAAVAAGNEAEHTRLAHLYHRAINLAAKSPRLAILLGTMTKQLPNRFYGMVEGQVKGAVDYHGLILDALKSRDAETARRLMQEHLMVGGEMLIGYLEQQGIWRDDEASGKKLRAAE